MNLVAVDMGFSNVKAVDGNGSNPVIFPHAVGTRARQTFSLDAQGRSDMVITLADGDTWAIGETALEQSDSPVARRDADWVLSQEYEALLCAALSELFWGDATATLATGLPVEHYDRHEKLRERLVGEHRFRRNGGEWQTVVVAPESIVAVQGLGAMLNQALDEVGHVRAQPVPGTNVTWAGGTIGVIDGGGLTVGFSAYRGLREIGKWTAGADLGLLGPIDAITRQIAADCPRLNPQPVEVAKWLARGNFTYLRQSHDIRPYAEGTLRAHADLVWRQAMTIWRSIGRMDAILLTGGQALALGQYLPEMMNGEGELLVTSPDPVFDNARGFLKLLRYRQRRKES